MLVLVLVFQLLVLVQVLVLGVPLMVRELVPVPVLPSLVLVLAVLELVQEKPVVVVEQVALVVVKLVMVAVRVVVMELRWEDLPVAVVVGFAGVVPLELMMVQLLEMVMISEWRLEGLVW